MSETERHPQSTRSRREFLKMLASATGGAVIGGYALTACNTASTPTAAASSASPMADDPPTATPVPTSTPGPVVNMADALGSGQVVQLPEPLFDETYTLGNALLRRKTTRTFQDKDLTVQILANLLWAGYGVNRNLTGGRTAPSAHNFHEMDLYTVTASGLHLYDAIEHTLTPLLAEDIRSKTGSQPFVTTAPLHIVYVVDYSRMDETGVTEEKKEHFSSVSTGCITQNVYLTCAVERLACVVRDTLNKPNLSKSMQLGEHQAIKLVHTIGY